jgi:hypothetical protein
MFPANCIGSAAAGMQSLVGNVAAGSLFAFCQSAAMGGYGAAVVSAVSGGVAVGAAIASTATNGDSSPPPEAGGSSPPEGGDGEGEVLPLGEKGEDGTPSRALWEDDSEDSEEDKEEGKEAGLRRKRGRPRCISGRSRCRWRRRVAL